MKLLEGKTALITGASRGIGKAVALAFAKQGANIAFTDLRYDENAQATEKEIEACGVKAKMYASNAADFAQTAATVEEIAKEFGRIDILVNNAGSTKDTLLMRMPACLPTPMPCIFAALPWWKAPCGKPTKLPLPQPAAPGLSLTLTPTCAFRCGRTVMLCAARCLSSCRWPMWSKSRTKSWNF